MESSSVRTAEVDQGGTLAPAEVDQGGAEVDQGGTLAPLRHSRRLTKGADVPSTTFGQVGGLEGVVY
jgi:hypothetical protein